MNVLDVLNDRVAQKLLASAQPARLAYTWMDGTPRVVPIWFHWTGSELVMASPCKPKAAPKLKAISSHPDVAVTIDGSVWPYQVLLVRGIAKVDNTEGIVPEYAAAAERYFGPDQGRAWIAQVVQMGVSFSRIAITPKHATILDFETRFPSALSA
jgi:nitroimidazol reductase NimA-like FMN-containing flavoprotein (pyridoxamine 5'-phosphate oxidase superfamily)